MKTSTFIGVTTGDPAGIGPEITLNSFKKMLVSDHPVPALVVGDMSVLRAAKERMNIAISLQPVTGVEEASSALKTGSIPVFDCAVIDDAGVFTPGRVSSICGKAAVRYVEKAVQLANDGSIHGLVTGPINKVAVKAAGYMYKGHTEMLKELTGSGKSITMFAVDGMKIIFHSRHISLRQALETLSTEEVTETIRTAERCLRSMGLNKPNIALAALNPHASDGGMFGTEEIGILEPAVKKTREEGIDVWGPAPADSVFHRCLQGDCDAVISLYHDQGHIAAKTYDFHRTVSITLGLPFIRTSVDHGTAFGIAWQGKALSTSMEESMRMCESLSEVYHPEAIYI